jgi:Kef-type K+ transport system membrane component KefB
MDNDPVIALFLALGVIIGAARLVGGLARKLDQPRVLGELLVGVILGPTVFNLLHTSALGLDQAHLEQTIHELAELGVLLLMFSIGLEVHLGELAIVGRTAAAAALGGVVLFVGLAMPLVMAFGYGWQPALFAVVGLAATSVSISAQVLLEMGLLRTKVGSALLATALIDDGVAILLVSLAVAVTHPQGADDVGSLVGIVVRMAVYMGAALAVAWFILPRLMIWVHEQPTIAHAYGVPAFALIVVLVFGWSASYLGGVAAITGAFIAGIGLSRTREAIKHQVEVAVANINYAFLVPIFFVSVGLQTDLRSFPLSGLPLAGLLLLAAMLAKIIGCGSGARWGGFSSREALQLGVCMISRGEVGLIVASLGLASGALKPEEPLFPSLFLVILLTAVLTPPLVRWVFRQPAAVVKGA